MELIKHRRFEVWGWQAFVNFTLGGMATGFYILIIAIDFILGDTPALLHSNTLKLIPPILVALGFLAVATEAGQPARGLYLIRNLRSSWMSRETVAGALFISATAADCFLPHIGLRILAIAAASGFLLSQGFIVYRACALPAWNVPIIPVYFISSSFSMGFGLWLLLGGFGKI
jgi:DMSO reductase anchor subunit